MTSSLKMTSLWKLVTSIFFCEAIGLLSAFISQADMYPWFDTLNKPTWNPPAHLFAPVWSLLYLFMGIAFWLVWKSNAVAQLKTRAMLVFGVQLLLNFIWSILFFKCHSLVYAFVDISFMIISIIATIFAFAPISRTASWLLVPYISWVCFAAILNYTIWVMNL